jgi:hypothetical protein
MSEDKQTPAQLAYSQAVSADPAAFYTNSGRQMPETRKTKMTPVEKARHEAFVNSHPFVRAQAADLQHGDDSEGGTL